MHPIAPPQSSLIPSAQKNLIDLPTEIWLHIIRFIPVTEVRDLYALNCVFFDVAMDEKYRHVTFDRLVHRSLKRIRCLLNPDIGRRVKSFRIAPHIFVKDSEALKNLQHERAIRESPMTHCLAKSQSRLITSSRQQATFSSFEPKPSDALLEMFRYLSGVDILCLCWDIFEDLPTRYLDPLWPTISPNLRELTIIVTTTKLGTLLPLPVTDFPRLTSLRLSIKRGSYLRELEADLPEDLQLAVAAFLNPFQDTLQHLSMHCMPTECDLQVLYKNLGYFKRLYSLDINLITPPPPEEEPAHCLLFMKRQSNNIRHFVMRASKYPPVKWQRPVNEDPNTHKYDFPNLNSLSMTAEIWTAGSPRVEVFMMKHRHLLQSLEIIGQFSPTEIDELLTTFDHRTTDCRLPKLSISIYRLDLNLLSKIMTSLPTLRTLKLSIMKVGNGTSLAFTPGQFFPLHLPPSEGVHEFVTEAMSCQDLKSSKLVDITLQRHSCCTNLTLWNLMRLFAMCMPSISSFAERGHMDIPIIPNAKAEVDGEMCLGNGSGCVYAMDGTDSAVC